MSLQSSLASVVGMLADIRSSHNSLVLCFPQLKVSVEASWSQRKPNNQVIDGLCACEVLHVEACSGRHGSVLRETVLCPQDLGGTVSPPAVTVGSSLPCRSEDTAQPTVSAPGYCVATRLNSCAYAL